MHNLSEGTKEAYLVRLRRFGLFLIKHGYKSFENANKRGVNEFLSGMKTQGTVNGYLTTLKPFYREFLNKEEVVKRARTDLRFLLLVSIWFATLAQRKIPSMATVAKETIVSFSIISDSANLQ
jgi:hypothetical protein